MPIRYSEVVFEARRRSLQVETYASPWTGFFSRAEPRVFISSPRRDGTSREIHFRQSAPYPFNVSSVVRLRRPGEGHYGAVKAIIRCDDHRESDILKEVCRWLDACA